MARRIDYGNWAQVIGTFDLRTRRGSIRSMLPTKLAFASKEGGEERARLKGFSEAGDVLFDLAVNPLTPSCGPPGDERMFEEFVPVTNKLRRIELFIDGTTASKYTPGSPQPRGSVELAAPASGREHRIPISGNAPAEPSVTYLVQVRPEGDQRWHTMATGLEQPNLASIDVNQFPGATALDIRVLRNNGFETAEVFSERREFKE